MNGFAYHWALHARLKEIDQAGQKIMLVESQHLRPFGIKGGKAGARRHARSKSDIVESGLRDAQWKSICRAVPLGMSE